MFLGSSDVHQYSLSLCKVAQLSTVNFDFVGIEQPFNAVLEFHDDSIAGDSRHEAYILLRQVNFVNMVELFILLFQDELIVGRLDDLVPDVEAHDPKFAGALAKHLEVLEGYDPGDLPHPQPQLPRTADLILLEVVVLLHVQLLDVADLRVHLEWVDH